MARRMLYARSRETTLRRGAKGGQGSGGSRSPRRPCPQGDKKKVLLESVPESSRTFSDRVWFRCFPQDEREVNREAPRGTGGETPQRRGDVPPREGLASRGALC